MLNAPDIYDAIYTLAADGACEGALFGNCAPLAHEAFLRSPSGGDFPLLWFEIPLAGKPRFDLHVTLSRESLCTDSQSLPDTAYGFDEVFRWYALDETGGNGLALAFDVSEGRIDAPALHVNVNDAPLANMNRFFDLAAGGNAYERYAEFESHMPQGWRIWYTGVHPGRPGFPIRIDCFVNAALKDAYAQDIALFERDLKACGFASMSPVLRELASPILQSPFPLKLQFDVMRDGTLGSTLGVSAEFSLAPAARVRQLFGESGSAAELMKEIEDMGLADRRWNHIPDAAFSKLLKVDGNALALYCAPTFVKLRMRDGEMLDAKAYLQASASVLA